jgi:hypothetical protein
MYSVQFQNDRAWKRKMAIVFGTGNRGHAVAHDHCNGGPRPSWFSAVRRCAPYTSKLIDSVQIVFHPPQGTFQLRNTHAP